MKVHAFYGFGIPRWRSRHFQSWCDDLLWDLSPWKAFHPGIFYFLCLNYVTSELFSISLLYNITLHCDFCVFHFHYVQFGCFRLLSKKEDDFSPFDFVDSITKCCWRTSIQKCFFNGRFSWCENYNRRWTWFDHPEKFNWRVIRYVNVTSVAVVTIRIVLVNSSALSKMSVGRSNSLHLL